MPTPAARRERAATILVVERDVPLAGLLGEILADEGYRAEVVHDGQTGLRSAGRTPPDLVVLEPRLPVVDPATFLETLRQLPGCGDLPVLALSDSYPEQLAAELDVQGVLGKPFEVDEFLRAVRRLARPPRTV